MKIKGHEVDSIVIRNENGEDIISISENSVINNSNFEVCLLSKNGMHNVYISEKIS